MLLFPGEEALYAPPPAWASLSDSTLQIVGKPLRFLTCNASCEREHRPLSCRVFPLTPLARDGSCAVALDVRAWPVCPLMGHGLEGLSREFVAAATAAAAILWENPACRAYIQTLSDQLASLASW